MADTVTYSQWVIAHPISRAANPEPTATGRDGFQTLRAQQPIPGAQPPADTAMHSVSSP